MARPTGTIVTKQKHQGMGMDNKGAEGGGGIYFENDQKAGKDMAV